MKTALVIPVAPDESFDCLGCLEKYGYVICVVDEDYPQEKYEQLIDFGVDVLRINGFGVGKALRYGFIYAREKYDPDWIIRSDIHVKFLSPPEELLRSEDYICSAIHLTPEGGISRGLMIHPVTWSFVWNRESRIIPMTHECVIAFSRKILDDHLNLLWNIPYWGKENLDTTLSLARFGHPVLITDFNVIHYYKKDWNPMRIEGREVNEPWLRDLNPGDNAYFIGTWISDIMFSIRHYIHPENFPFWEKIPAIAKYITRRYFNVEYLEAPLSLFDLTFIS